LPAKVSGRGLRPGELVESFVMLSALGGECLDDFDRLRRDRGLAALLGYELPAASTARQYLDRGFHDPAAVKGRPTQGSFIPAEEFRDGNVPAASRIKELVDEAFAALPNRKSADPWRVSVRSDSAAYGRTVLDHWDGRQWRFAVSADMSPQLKREVVRLPFEAWQPWAVEATG